MYIKFTVLGEPQGKGRPRFAKINGQTIVRTPEKTAIYENLVAIEYKKAAMSQGFDRFGDSEELKMRIKAYYQMPKAARKRRQELMMLGEVRPTKKPDVDNIIKVIADSLNGIAYRDDAQIVSVECQKFYSDTPRVEVEIYPRLEFKA